MKPDFKIVLFVKKFFFFVTGLFFVTKAFLIRVLSRYEHGQLKIKQIAQEGIKNPCLAG